MKLSKIQYIELAAMRIILNDDEQKMLALFDQVTDSSYQQAEHPIELYLQNRPYTKRSTFYVKVILRWGIKKPWVKSMLTKLLVSGRFNQRFEAADIGVSMAGLIEVFTQIAEALEPVVRLTFVEGVGNIFVSASSQTLPALLEKYTNGLDEHFGKINAFNWKKQTPKEYYSDKYGSDNWFRKVMVDPDGIERFTAGKLILMMPVHLLPGNPVCLNYNKSERERIYVIEGSSKPYRKFDGSYKKHCSRCPFEEGCVMCTLP